MSGYEAMMEVRFACDSPLEGSGFEPLVPLMPKRPNGSMPVSATSALAGAGAAVTRDFTLPKAEAAYAVFLEGGLSAIELRSFLDLRLPKWLPQKIPSGRSDRMTVFLL
jgi:hypothetical protein